MHINPNEDPVAGKESEILFLINDKDKKFQPENCDCQASVMFGTTTLLNQQVSTAKTSYRGIFAPAIPFTFPQKGIYSIKLMGEPKNEQSFQKFSITYSIKVDRDANTTPTPPFKKALSYIITIGALITVTYIIKLSFGTRDTNAKKF